MKHTLLAASFLLAGSLMAEGPSAPPLSDMLPPYQPAASNASPYPYKSHKDFEQDDAAKRATLKDEKAQRQQEKKETLRNGAPEARRRKQAAKLSRTQAENLLRYAAAQENALRAQIAFLDKAIRKQTSLQQQAPQSLESATLQLLGLDQNQKDRFMQHQGLLLNESPLDVLKQQLTATVEKFYKMQEIQNALKAAPGTFKTKRRYFKKEQRSWTSLNRRYRVKKAMKKAPKKMLLGLVTLID